MLSSQIGTLVVSVVKQYNQYWYIHNPLPKEASRDASFHIGKTGKMYTFV